MDGSLFILSPVWLILIFIWTLGTTGLVATFSTSELRNMLEQWIITASGLKSKKPKSAYEHPKIRNSATLVGVAQDILQDKTMPKELCEAFNSLGVIPRGVIGVGASKITFDIGNGRSARFSPYGWRDPQEGGGVFRAIEEIEVGDGVLEIMGNFRLASKAEADFMLRCMSRQGYKWKDPKTDNAGRDPETNQLGVFDGMVVPIEPKSQKSQIAIYELKKPGKSKMTYVAEYWDGKKSSWLSWNQKASRWKSAPGMGRFFEPGPWTNDAVLRPISRLDKGLTKSGIDVLPTVADFSASGQSIA